MRRRLALFVLVGIVALLLASHLLFQPGHEPTGAPRSSLTSPPDTARLVGRKTVKDLPIRDRGAAPVAEPNAEDARISIRVETVDGRPLPDAVLGVCTLESGGAWGMERVLALFADPIDVASERRVPRSLLPSGLPFLLLASHPGYERATVLIAEEPTEEILVQLAPGRRAIVRVVSAGTGDPLDGVTVELCDAASSGRAPRGGRPTLPTASPPASPPCRQATTDPMGETVFRGLGLDVIYRVSLASGQDLVRPILGTRTLFLFPSDERITLRVEPAYAVWFRVVDQETGRGIRTASWSSPLGRDRSLSQAHRGDGDARALGLEGRVLPGDFHRVLVRTGPDDGPESPGEAVQARYRVSAPGYASSEIRATVLPLSRSLRRGPQRVRLRRTEPLGTLLYRISPDTAVDRLLVTVRSRDGGTWEVWDRLEPGRGRVEGALQVPAGGYEVAAGRSRGGVRVDVRAGATSVVMLEASSWAAVRFRLEPDDGEPMPVAVFLMLARSDGTFLLDQGPLSLQDGCTRLFALPRSGPMMASFVVAGQGRRRAVVRFSPLEEVGAITEVIVRLK